VTIALGGFLTFVFSILLEEGQLRYYVHKYSKTQELFVNKKSYDVLFIGSSRTHGTIDPGIIDSVTGNLDTYNAGMEGATVPEFKLVLDAYLQKHSSPRLVILTLDRNSFDTRRKMFFPFQYFWVMQNPVIRENIRSNKDFRFSFVRLGPLLRQIYYDDYTKVLAIRGLMGKTELTDGGFSERKGYSNNVYHCADTLKKYTVQKLAIDKNATDMLRAIIDTCRSRNIGLVFSYAPEYDFRLQSSMSNFNEFIQTVNEIAKENGIPFFREDLLSMCQDPCLFANYGHVNIYGAAVYSTILGKRIRDSLLKN
jgi:hypothetical protein